MKISKLSKLLLALNLFMFLLFVVANIIAGAAIAEFFSINAEMEELTSGLNQSAVLDNVKFGCFETCLVDKVLNQEAYTAKDSVYCKTACGLMG